MRFLCFLCFITTFYTDKTYTTYCAVEVDAPAEISDTIFQRFIHDFRSSPDALFDWAFYGVGAQEDQEKNSFLLEYTETVYIPEEQYGRVTVDVIIPGFTRFRNIRLEGKVIDEQRPVRFAPLPPLDSLTPACVPDFNRHFNIDVTYTGQLLERGYGDIFIIPVDSTHSVFFMDVNFKYGWFFNIFITKKVYRNSVEWRANRYMHNLKRVAEELYAEQQGRRPLRQPAPEPHDSRPTP